MTLPTTGSQSLKVVALISGGKDSLFSLLHCQQHGHEVVALANLYPVSDHHLTSSDEPIDDVDSYMYQTIGHTVIHLYAEALGLPLYRQPICGTNADANKVYTQDDADETESLVPLLRNVMRAHPHINAVSTGAILSDYQRTRVESVALRLGLVPLAYLWQYPRLPPHMQTSLLEDMRIAGQDSRIIKVASGGLGEGHLWLGLGEQGTVKQLVRDFGRFSGSELETGAVLGEGGEYETLAVCGPRQLWKRKIVIEDDQRATLKGEGGTWMLRFGKANTQDLAQETFSSEGIVREPDLLDAKFDQLRQHFSTGNEKAKTTAATNAPMASRQEEARFAELDRRLAWQIKEMGDQLMVSNMSSKGAKQDITKQTHEIMHRLTDMLREQGLSPANISLSVIVLRNMSDFALVNEAYAQSFDRPSPPARVTVACGETMPAGKQIMMTVQVSRAPRADRTGLHVQSRSYWAPANIGPYSQAISVPMPGKADCRDVFIAGQIPLRPATMDITPGDFTAQALLALQHLWRVGQAMKVQWWRTGAIAFVTAASREELRSQTLIIEECWRLAHSGLEEEDNDDDDEEDIAETSLRRGWNSGGRSISIKTPLWPIPDWHRVNVLAPRASIPQCFTIQMERLPRDAQVEWWSQGVEMQSNCTELKRSSFLALASQSSLEAHEITALKQATGPVEVFASTDLEPHLLDLLQEIKAMWIPCKGISSREHGEIKVLIRYG